MCVTFSAFWPCHCYLVCVAEQIGFSLTHLKPPRQVFSQLYLNNSYQICLLLYVQVNSYGHVGTVSSPNYTFYLGKLEPVVNQYFVLILWLVTYNNASGREENDRRNYFMTNLHEGMGPGWDRTHDPWICSQTRIRSMSNM